MVENEQMLTIHAMDRLKQSTPKEVEFLPMRGAHVDRIVTVSYDFYGEDNFVTPVDFERAVEYLITSGWPHIVTSYLKEYEFYEPQLVAIAYTAPLCVRLEVQMKKRITPKHSTGETQC